MLSNTFENSAKNRPGNATYCAIGSTRFVLKKEFLIASRDPTSPSANQAYSQPAKQKPAISVTGKILEKSQKRFKKYVKNHPKILSNVIPYGGNRSQGGGTPRRRQEAKMGKQKCGV